MVMQIASSPGRGRRGLARIASTRQTLRSLLTTNGSKRRIAVGSVVVPSLVDQVESVDDEDASSSTAGSTSSDDDHRSACQCELSERDQVVVKEERLRRRPFRWIPSYLCRNMPSLVDEAEDNMSSAVADEDDDDLPSDSFIGVAPSYYPSEESTEESSSSESSITKEGSATDHENDDHDEYDWHEEADGTPVAERRVRFAPMVKKIQYHRHDNRAAVWWTREDRRRTIEEASNEINVYIRQFPETFRTIVLLCQDEMHDYTTFKEIMPVRGLLRPCLNRLSRNDALVRTWVQKARKSVSQVVQLQATDVAIAHYSSYSLAASRMAAFVAQADARAALEEPPAVGTTRAPVLASGSSSSETLMGPSERITV